MAFVVGVPEERADGERRVALAPEMAGRLVQQGFSVRVARDAGRGAFFTEEAYRDAGAELVSQEEALQADAVLKVQPPTVEEIAHMKSSATYVGLMQPLDDPAGVEALAEAGVTGLSMELVPRISRAQRMDALSAMSAVGGYKAVLNAAAELPRFFPLLTTAAGTIRPASVLVLGAGVAGLQAIATARRLGARASAYDIREAVREEVQSLGARFVELQLDTKGSQDEGGYAKALQREKQERQTELLVPHIGRADVLVTTALIPGRAAPTLITEEAVRAMKPGSVIVDMAAPNGGNCVLTEPGETVVQHGVTIMGPLNLPAEIPVHASEMYGRTVAALFTAFADPEEGLRVDFDDEIFEAACVTHGGEVVNERVRSLLVA